jgi:hypothetical protein
MNFVLDWGRDTAPLNSFPEDKSRYEALCSSIEQNDPTCTVIPANVSRFHAGMEYGACLGQAIKENILVSILNMQLIK